MVAEIRTLSGISTIEKLAQVTRMSQSRIRKFLEEVEHDTPHYRKSVTVQCSIDGDHYRKIRELAEKRKMPVSEFLGTLVSAIIDCTTTASDIANRVKRQDPE